MSKFGVCLPLILLAACGGSHAPAAAAKPAEHSPADTNTDTDSDSDAGAESKPAGKADKADKASAKSSDDGPKATRSAQDILTAPDVVFMFSFNDSDVKQTADSKCTAASGNDPKKMSQCMSKAHKGFEVDGYRFKEKDGKWWWLTLHVKGKVISTLHKFEVEFGPETKGSVVLKPKGKDLGTAAGRTPASVTFEVPNDYQIVVNDSKLGKLVYEAKIGTATE